MADYVTDQFKQRDQAQAAAKAAGGRFKQETVVRPLHTDYAFRVDVYEGPAGTGYVKHAFRIVGGKLQAMSEHTGPEKRVLARGWVETEDPVIYEILSAARASLAIARPKLKEKGDKKNARA